MAGTISKKNITLEGVGALGSNVSVMTDKIFSPNALFVSGKNSHMAYRTHLPYNFYEIEPDNVPYTYNNNVIFTIPKNRLIIRGMYLQVRFLPGSLQNVNVPRPIADGEYIFLTPYAPLILFQENQTYVRSGGNSRTIHIFPFTIRILQNAIDSEVNFSYQDERNILGRNVTSHLEKENYFWEGGTFSIPLDMFYWDMQNAHHSNSFLPVGILSNLKLQLRLTNPSQFINSNIPAADIVFPVPEIKLLLMTSELGATIYDNLITNYYTHVAHQEHNFVQMNYISDVFQVPVGKTDYVVEISKLLSLDTRRIFFFLAPSDHSVGIEGVLNYNNDPFNFKKCWPIESFYFSIQNTVATISQSDYQNRKILRDWYCKGVRAEKDNLYFYSFAEFPKNFLKSSGSKNLSAQLQYYLKMEFTAIPAGYSLQIYVETENIMVQNNMDLTPLINY